MIRNNTPTTVNEQEQLPNAPLSFPGGQGYLDFQAQEWKCPDCGRVNSMADYTCKCGMSAYNILQELNKPKGTLSKKRGGRRIGLKAGFKFVIGASWLIVLIVTAYLLLALSPVIIYLAPAFLVLSALVCVLYPRKKDKKKAAKILMDQLGDGLIELAGLIEEQAGF
jgi:hypothetical protein